MSEACLTPMPKHRQNYTGRIFTFFTGYTTPRHGGRLAAPREARTKFADESACLTPNNVQNEVKFLTLFTDHRRSWKCCASTRRHSSHRRKMSDLPFETALQEYYFQFPYEYSLLVLFRSAFTNVNFKDPQKKNHKD
jgi:hypothetical protein